jgi:hypothetical protein
MTKSAEAEKDELTLVMQENIDNIGIEIESLTMALSDKDQQLLLMQQKAEADSSEVDTLKGTIIGM